ncbi:uncharacterized protein MELLADRAFT_60280 [Melampsora larici-populina 98AG31]|uniref:Uncharacterized protein n=1 Tax=Melampsora larici-populina (strain 98AG31 / pathotype 3-4-7) TaxID=747676 RepID=F4RAR6_MELLP|nr:uncharacterized protein MELLADRAFT_60280 [Melampsora larici-populina 98AG31]EGG10734.1 hypothetical protein MELLADRAFT_60280 [Melampsora larici-populina 98AG31]
MPSCSLGQGHFYDEIGFPLTFHTYQPEDVMVNKLSYSHELPKTPPTTSRRNFLRGALGRTRQASIDPLNELLPVVYNSFFKTTKTIQDLQSQPSQPVHFGIQKLAEKVLVLVNTLGNQHVPQTDWLKKHEHLVKECQDLAQESLLNPHDLKDLERLWATGIWVALEIGKWGRTDNIPMPDGLRNQVKLEIQAAWHYGAQFTEAFDHWMRKEIPTRGHDHGLEECLKRAELIGQHEKEDGYQIGRIRHPTDRMVAEYLSGHTLPREAVLVQGLLAEFQEIFQEPHHFGLSSTI